jgi:flavin reductase (DIM6/NTAB) family NADH-FMN oxidoreductase RutF
MTKRVIEPNTTLYPVPVVLITTGGETANVMTCNRVVSCSAEPPRIAISVRPMRHSHTLIKRSREFVVNIPTPDQLTLSDYVGVVTGAKEDKIEIAGLKLAPGLKVQTPLLVDCPVNIECTVEYELELDSHTMFIGQVQAVHADESLLDSLGDVDLRRAAGIVYEAGVVRERPTYKVRIASLREAVQKG